jgi:CheY-like chemotaxis protein
MEGRILVVDDEENILKITQSLLKAAGYECDAADSVRAATHLLARQTYDLLITDIQMPGNANLEFIKEKRNFSDGLPVILMTGYPQVDTAIKSISLGVVAYLVKPSPSEDLLNQVRIAIQGGRILGVIAEQSHRLKEWLNNLNELELLSNRPGGAAALPIDGFIELTCNNIIGLVSDLKHLTDAAIRDKASSEACHLMNCPRTDALYGALGETVETLEKTKNSFKSKELGLLRKKLETILKNRGRISS